MSLCWMLWLKPPLTMAVSLHSELCTREQYALLVPVAVVQTPLQTQRQQQKQVLVYVL